MNELLVGYARVSAEERTPARSPGQPLHWGDQAEIDVEDGW